MRTPERKATVVVFLALALIAASCRQSSVQPPTSGVQPLPQTALQRVIVYNFAMSEANLVVGRMVRDAQASGAITVAQARPLVEGSVKIATVSEQIRGITSQGTEATWAVDGPKVRALIAETPLRLPASANVGVDVVIEAANAALILLTQGAK